jgi:hypothetical protein
MAEFDAWNKAIAAYFTAGAAKGSPIFLSLDLEAIEDIAARFVDEGVCGDPLLDFTKAVRRQCVSSSGDHLNLDTLQGKDGEVPAGVAFLGLMVFAAYNMQEEEGVDESNYFLRLREVLGLPHFQGRPDGMPPGAEESLWIEWNKHLTSAGFQPTAERGAGPQTYLRYVLSQAILRESDKQFLRKCFHDAHLPLQFDSDQLGFWLSRQTLMRRHLEEGLHHSDPGRAWEFYQAAHRVYESGDWALGIAPHQTSERNRGRSIECGIYRTVDLLGDAEYLLFPKQPARTRSSQLATTQTIGGSTTPLRPIRAGFFGPLWRVAPFGDQPLEFDVVGDPVIRKMLFPRRDFWVLVQDPENQQGVWATWKPYLELGETLLLLCRTGAMDNEMARFKEAKLVDWTARVEADGVIEYQGCMVLSYDWGGFISRPECRALADALAPRSMAGVSLVGGLRDPNQNAWLEGFSPSVKVYGFDKEFELVITSSQGYAWRKEVPRQHEVPLDPDLEPGTYQIEVRWNRKRAAVRMFRIISWSSIQEHPGPEEIINTNPAATAGLALRGARILSGGLEATEVAGA